MLCPRQCGVELRPINIEGVPVEVHLCQKCEGAWYPQEVLAEVTDVGCGALAASDLSVVLEADHLEAVDLEQPLNCPVCAQAMSRFSYALSPELKIDECIDHGTWLDDGELGTIMQKLSQRENELKVVYPELAAERAEAQAELDEAARGGSVLNPFSLTIRALNAIFSRHR